MANALYGMPDAQRCSFHLASLRCLLLLMIIQLILLKAPSVIKNGTQNGNSHHWREGLVVGVEVLIPLVWAVHEAVRQGFE